MRSTQIIIALIVMIACFACEDKTVYHDTMEEPVKALDIEVSEYGMTALTDGSAATLIQTDNPHWQYDYNPETDISDYVIAKIARNGNIQLSDTFSLLTQTQTKSVDNKIFTPITGDIFVYNKYHDDYSFDYDDNTPRILTKITHNGNKAYTRLLVREESCTALDNGDYALFSNDTLRQYYNLNDNSNLFYVMDQSPLYLPRASAISFEDKIILYADNIFLMYHTDGTLVTNETFDSKASIYNVKYVKGYLYFVLQCGSISTNSTNYPIYKYVVTKKDALSTQIHSDTIVANFINDNIVVQNDTLIVHGIIQKNVEDNDFVGAIYFFDNEDGHLIETITLDNDDSSIIPYIISPDLNGEYDVYATKRNKYDSRNNTNNSNPYCGRLFIYHIDDLHKLKQNN